MGYDLNYVGIIFGKEIGYDLEQLKFIIRSGEYKDRNGKNGTNIADLEWYIIDIYETLLLRGIWGSYVYCCDEGLKEYFRRHIKLYKSRTPR